MQEKKRKKMVNKKIIKKEKNYSELKKKEKKSLTKKDLADGYKKRIGKNLREGLTLYAFKKSAPFSK